MNRKTLTALKASIKHWEENSKAVTLQDCSTLAEDCALCLAFIDNECSGCPVAARGKVLCGGTPYPAAWRARTAWIAGHGNGAAFRAAARKELAFLKSLLPKPKKAAKK